MDRIDLIKNQKYSQSLPVPALMQLDYFAKIDTERTGIKTSRTQLVKIAVAEYLEKRSSNDNS